MVDHNYIMGNEINPVFERVGRTINSQLQQMLNICEQHDDTRWLLGQFAEVLNSFTNETVSSSIDGVGFYIEPDISEYNGKISGPCWFYLIEDDANSDYDDSDYCEYMYNEYDFSADNGNLNVDERDRCPLELLIPDGLAAYVRVNYVYKKCFGEDSVLEDSDALKALEDFAEFIENCCQDAIDTVNIAIRRRYRYMK